jgi:NAD(P)-dependent dehydrogenase (short-subunit alcohol dehydrogenase family)
VELVGDGDEVAKLPQVQRGPGRQTHAGRVSPAPEEVLRTTVRGGTVVGSYLKGAQMNASTSPQTTTNGRVAIVTGGTANLGKLFAEALAGDGVNVVVHYNSLSRADEAATAVSELEKLGVGAVAHQGDLTDLAEITRLVDATVERFGKWDILVNTAGLIVRKPLVETTEKEYDDSFTINSKIPYFFMREAYNKMADNGRIINIVTTQVAVTAATYSAYAGSKAPVEHFTKAFAKEIGPRGVTVNCIAPGPQKTSFFYNAENDETIAWLSGMTISGDLGDPVDVVPVMRFLAAPETRWVTAQTVYVNGGMISPIN